MALEPAHPSKGPEEGTVKTTVWVVDDSQLQGDSIRRSLAKQFAVEVFVSGAVALECMANAQAPDVLLLDWYMPDVSGHDVCRFVRKTFNSSQLPIVILTGTGTSTELLEALAAGANDFLQMPIAPAELQARVQSLASMAQLHAQLEETERKLRLEAVFRERFMALLAHDLRQPLSTVLLGFPVLTAMGLPAEAAKVTFRQQRAAERMQRMVTDLLDSTRHRPESGMPIQKRQVDLAHIARTTLDEIRAAHPGRELALSVCDSCYGNWDPDRLAQVLSNLVGNAIAHGERGSPVVVVLSCESDDHVALRVSNRGQAIPEEVLATLEHPFKTTRTASHSTEGFGLGLHIVTHIVRAHGGTMSAESQGGETSVVVHLPRN